MACMLNERNIHSHLLIVTPVLDKCGSFYIFYFDIYRGLNKGGMASICHLKVTCLTKRKLAYMFLILAELNATLGLPIPSITFIFKVCRIIFLVSLHIVRYLSVYCKIAPNIRN